MALQSRLQESESESPGDGTVSEASEQPGQSIPDEISPFSMGYDFSEYQLDADETDQVLGLMIATTNLL
jgi:hypothetical protein